MEVAQLYDAYFKDGNVSTDSRKIKPGDIFIALRGDHFDGNKFAADAIRAGAAVAVVDEGPENRELPLVRVENSLQFLQKMANHHRRTSGFKVIAITGSNGKTTTKELLFHILSRRFRTRATAGNLNNHIGVPLTLLTADKQTEFSIVEMGANHQGEIRQLCEIAEPDCGLITNIGKAHLEGFGSYEGVIRAKSELYQYLIRNKRTLFINAADPTLLSLAGPYHKLVPYNTGTAFHANILETIPRLRIKLISGKRSTDIRSLLFGKFNADNILAAATTASHFGIGLQDIKEGVESYMPENLRSQVLEVKSTLLILDCYNANPTSMKLAIQEFSKLPKTRKIAIIGSMKELGPVSDDEHTQIVELLDQQKIDRIILIGEEFSGKYGKHTAWFATAEQAADAVKNLDVRDAAVLLKGSRANQLEKLQDIIQHKLAE